jgi:preprotein translocase subunit YajC
VGIVVTCPLFYCLATRQQQDQQQRAERLRAGYVK